MHEYGPYSAGERTGKQPSTPVAANSYMLSMQARPNPFNPSTQIHFRLPVAGVVSLRIFDVNGRLVRQWNNEPRNAGKHVILWEGRDQAGQFTASGIYFAELVWGKARQIAKMTLVR